MGRSPVNCITASNLLLGRCSRSANTITPSVHQDGVQRHPDPVAGHPSALNLVLDRYSMGGATEVGVVIGAVGVRVRG